MQAIEGMTANSKANFSPMSDIIGALQTILAHSHVTMSDLETQYSPSFPNTNYYTIEPNDQSISDIITERQQQLGAVLDEISGLEAVMDSVKNLHQKLVEKKDKITQSIDLHKRLVSALWRLPTEVLSHIFLYCLPKDKYLSPAPQLAPILLTRICRRWREIVVGLPDWWCRLSMPVDLRSQWQRQAFCHDLWLKRSQGHPLSLALNCSAMDSTKLRSLLQPYINQISSLSIEFSRSADQPELLLDNLPALQELTIITMNGQAIAQCMSRLPSTLSSLKFIGLSFDLELSSSCNSVWAHLTNLEIDIRYQNAVLHLLHLCPNLSSLTIRIAFDEMETLGSFTHTKIQSLRIVDHSMITRPLYGLFNALSLPNLRVLEAFSTRTWPHEEFKLFLARANCPLETLVFAGVMTTDEQQAEYVAVIPSIDVVVLRSLDVVLRCFA